MLSLRFTLHTMFFGVSNPESEVYVKKREVEEYRLKEY